MSKLLSILKYVPILFEIGWNIRKFFINRKLEKLMSTALGIENTKGVVNEINEAIKVGIKAAQDGIGIEDLSIVPLLVGSIMKIFNNYAEAKAETADLSLEEYQELTTFVVNEVFETLKAVKK